MHQIIMLDVSVADSDQSTSVRVMYLIVRASISLIVEL